MVEPDSVPWAEGRPGLPGTPGDPGASIVGPKGDKGDPGQSVVGPKGDKGDPGNSITGPKGDKGDPGASITGPKGDKGDAGAPGAKGKDAYEDWLEARKRGHARRMAGVPEGRPRRGRDELPGRRARAAGVPRSLRQRGARLRLSRDRYGRHAICGKAGDGRARSRSRDRRATRATPAGKVRPGAASRRCIWTRIPAISSLGSPMSRPSTLCWGRCRVWSGSIRSSRRLGPRRSIFSRFTQGRMPLTSRPR